MQFEQERGHVASAVECCMKQYGVSKKEAYDMLNKMVESDWKDINEELLKPSTVPRQVLILMLNLARIIDVVYKDYDGYTEAKSATKEMLTAFLVDPLPVVA
jgi:(-)-germacrene D synthase